MELTVQKVSVRLILTLSMLLYPICLVFQNFGPLFHAFSSYRGIWNPPPSNIEMRGDAFPEEIAPFLSYETVGCS